MIAHVASLAVFPRIPTAVLGLVAQTLVALTLAPARTNFGVARTDAFGRRVQARAVPAGPLTVAHALAAVALAVVGARAKEASVPVARKVVALAVLTIDELVRVGTGVALAFAAHALATAGAEDLRPVVWTTAGLE